MALIKLPDGFVPEVWNQYTQELTSEKSALIQSGVTVTSADMQAKIDGGGLTFNMPFWNDLDATNPDISTDDEATSSVPEKIGSRRDIATRHTWNKSWSAADITATLFGDDGMERMANRVAGYWTRVYQNHLIYSLNGALNTVAFAAGTPNQNLDLVNNIAVAGASTANSLLTTNSIIQTAALAGDSQGMFTAIAMHSSAKAYLRSLNMIDFIRDAENNITISTFQGMRVIEDDGIPYARNAAPNEATATTTLYLFREGSVGYAEGSPRVPFEVTREALQGNGGGVEIITSRREIGMHPLGIAWTGVAASTTPSQAELEDATNWQRVTDAKNFGIRALVCNVPSTI